MIPSPADLAYFVETARTGNISRAAERIGISQPSLSLALRRLEDAAGETLLLRSRKGVTLTRAGEALLAGARGLQQEWEKLRSAAHSARDEIGGGYTLGCHPSVALHALPRILPGLLAAHPALDLRLEHGLSRHVAEGVVSMTIDVGIVVNPMQHPDLVIHNLCRDEVTLWTGPKNKNKDILICDPELMQSQYLLRELKKAGREYSRIVTSNSLENIAAQAAAGCGTGVLPAQVARRAPGKLTRVKGAPVFHDDHCLIYRVENKNVRSVQALARAVREFYEAA
ncbi:MAG: LysR family transcriptional regulator [Alphaproteobacteria bacterium]|nr:LysR family transcriptional regulator [Alphaproteobacteria bacterium]